MIRIHMWQEENMAIFGQPLQFITPSPTKWTSYHKSGRCYLKLALHLKVWPELNDKLECQEKKS